MRTHNARRNFLQGCLAGAGYFVAARVTAQQPKSPNSRIRFACIGTGGKGSSNTDSAAKAGDIVALCDIDDAKLAGKANAHPLAKKHFDFRKVLEDNENEIDAVVVSTPDHTHAAISLMAMRMGKHVYCEKPLCRYLYEARQLATVAREQKVVTQMGNQSTVSPQFRNALDAVRSGLIGQIREIHAWTHRPQWPQGGNLEPKLSSIPAGIHWNEFLGPAADAPFSSDYLPFKWRAWWRFGGGALGDMSCHILNLALHAADLRNPISVEAQHTGHNRMTYPASSTLRWEFAATRKRPALTLHWYDGGRKPDATLLDGETITNSGCLLLGDRGKIVSLEDYNLKWIRLPARQPLVPNSANDYLVTPIPDHFQEFAAAIQVGGTTMSNFPDVGGPLTETVLLGNLAIWAGPQSNITWDAAKLTTSGAGDLQDAIKPVYRAGYTL